MDTLQLGRQIVRNFTRNLGFGPRCVPVRAACRQILGSFLTAIVAAVSLGAQPSRPPSLQALDLIKTCE